MGWISGIVVYFVTWFIVLFMVLPWGVRPADHPELGHDEGAPERPRLALKFAVTTGIAAVIWLIIFVLVEADVVSFRDMARDM